MKLLLTLIGIITLIIVAYVASLFFIYAPEPDKCQFSEKFSCNQKTHAFVKEGENLSLLVSIVNLDRPIEIKGIQCLDKPSTEISKSDITNIFSDSLKSNESKDYLVPCNTDVQYPSSAQFRGSLAILYDNDRISIGTVSGKITNK